MHRMLFKPMGEILSKRKLQCVLWTNAQRVNWRMENTLSFSLMITPDAVSLRSLKQPPQIIVMKDLVPYDRSDNGGEYLSNEFEVYLKSKGICHELTVSHSPEQNGVTTIP